MIMIMFYRLEISFQTVHSIAECIYDCLFCFHHKLKGHLNSEWIYKVIVSPKMPTKHLKDFCPGGLLEGRAEILQIFGWHDLINSFWIYWPLVSPSEHLLSNLGQNM